MKERPASALEIILDRVELVRQEVFLRARDDEQGAVLGEGLREGQSSAS